MLQILTRSWWLFALCGILDARVSVLYFSHAERGFSSKSLFALLGELAIAAGLCILAAGVWNFRNRNSWLLIIHGLALTSLGSIFAFWLPRRLSFRTLALLIVVMALSIGVYEWVSARASRHRPVGKWLLRLAAVVSAVFILPFLALGFRWIPPAQGPAQTVDWLGAYFAFTALCMFALAQINVGDHTESLSLSSVS